MTKDRKRKKLNTSTDEESFDRSGKNANTDRKKDMDREMDKEDQSDSDSEMEDVEVTQRKVEHAINELEEIRSRCNGRISGQIKSVLAEIRKGTRNLVKIAESGEAEREEMKLEIGLLKAKTEELNKDFVESTEAMKRELAGIRNLREEMKVSMKKDMEAMMKNMFEGPRPLGNRGEKIGASSTPIIRREIGRIEEENRIDTLEEVGMEKRDEEDRQGISYAEIAGRKTKRIFGRRAGFQVETKAIVERRQNAAEKEYPLLETPRPQRRKEEDREKRMEARKTDERVENLRIKSERGYLEILGKIRKGIDPRESGVIVLSSKKDLNGVLTVKVKGKEECLQKFREALKGCLEGDSKIEKVQRMGYLHVGNLDYLTTEEEIRGKISEVAGIGEEEIRVTSLRPAFGSTQKATVKLPKDAAIRAAKEGRILIGYVTCRIYVRTFEERCFKCGGTGHVAARCEKEDYVGKCFRCEKEGHFARECPDKTGKTRRSERNEERNEERNKELQRTRNEGEQMQTDAFEDAPDKFE